MRLNVGLNLQQTQKLIMTPELRQAIAILQLPALELSHFIEEQLLENPLLETKDEPRETDDKDLSADMAEEPWSLDWQGYLKYQEEKGIRQKMEDAGEEDNRFEPFIATAPTLQEHLLTQLHIAKTSVPQFVAEYIIGNLDDNGYLRLSLEEIANELNVPLATVEKALKLVQSFDPPGVGARSIKECLALQLPHFPDCPPLTSQFLDYLEDLAAGRLQRIANALSCSLAEVQEMADFIKQLDPKPGRRFSGPGEVRFIVPDVIIEEIEGEYIILVNDVTVPRLHINQAYRQILNQSGDEETRKFVEQKLNSAAWLIKSIEQRRLTLYKVANAIVNRQKEFLRHGIRYLKPLTLKDIAEEIGVHESTVSRATANKYVQTPRGVFEFKFFFANAVGQDQEVATDVIKAMIKELIAKENPKSPYSDQKIADLLNEKGIKISRRTVAKYRDELGIPVMSLRKRY